MLRDMYEVGRIIGAASDITGKINTAFDSPYEMSPAFNVKKSAILFTSQVKKADADGYNAEYKLTLLDRDIKTTLGAMTRTGNVVRIPYSVTGEKRIMLMRSHMWLQIRLTMQMDQKSLHMVS